MTSLAGWRQFAAEVTAVPGLLGTATWQELDPDKRASYDDDRIAHHSRLLVIQTPAVRDVVTTGRRLAHMNRSAPFGRSGLIVSGPARTGKTTAITQLGKTIEVIHRRRYPGCGDHIPVIYITAPPAATPRMIAAEFAGSSASRSPGRPTSPTSSRPSAASAPMSGRPRSWSTRSTTSTSRPAPGPRPPTR
jgi:hypothetical protein